MFNSDAQRANQYEELLQDEFHLILLERKPNNQGQVFLQELDKECLGAGMRNSSTKSRVNAFRSKVKGNKERFTCQIRRIPHKIDKRVRDKDTLWCRWNLQSLNCVWFAVHYALELLPAVAQVLEQNGKFLDLRFMFFHTKKLHAMNGSAVIHDMASFYNWNAKKHGFAQVQKTTGATVWRHAFATSEFQKFDSRTDFGWCNSDEEVARQIAFRMNTSAEEILTTYTTRVNASVEAEGSDRAAHATSFVIEIETSSSEDDLDSTEARMVTPTAAKKRQHSAISQGDQVVVDEDGDDPRKQPAKKRPPREGSEDDLV